MMVERLKVGRANKHMPGGTVKFMCYGGGETAILIMNADGSRECVATVNLEAEPPENYVWLKTWAEHEGIPEALAAAGVVVLTERTLSAGFSHARLARLTPAAIKQRDMELHA
jgi:hypothetical protein